MKSSKVSLTINVKQLHQNCRHGGRAKTWLLVALLVLLAIGRLVLSTLSHSDIKEDEASAENPAESSSSSLGTFSNMSPKLMDPMLLGVDLASPFLDSGSMTAIVPATEDSLEEVYEAIDVLVSDESSLSAIIIVCPEPIVPGLLAALSERHQDAFLDLTIALWPEGLGEGSALANAASGVLTEYALIIDSASLDHLHEDLHEHILSHPLLLSVPTGPCGGNFTSVDGQPICVVPGAEPRSASFLFPPFIVPSSLIRGLNATAVGDADFWAKFGETMIDVTGAGALVPESSGASDVDWCRSLCRTAGLVTDDSSTDQCGTPISLEKNYRSRSDPGPSHSSSLAIILPTLRDLEAFSSVACRFSEGGYNAHVLIMSQDLDLASSHESSFPWLHDHFISSVCNISYSALHISSNHFANAEAVNFWLESANETMSVILYGKGGLDRASELPFASVLESQSSMGVSVIQIPQADIPYCDWIASLSLQELRSTSRTFLTIHTHLLCRLAQPGHRNLRHH